MYTRSRLLFLFAFLVFSIGSLYAQNAVSNGAISGIVTDGVGALVPDAQVELTNTETGIKLSGRTNSSGLYSYPTLPVGIYSICITAPGFKTAFIPTVPVTIGRTSTAGIQLQVGAVNEQVTVTSTMTPLLDTSDSSVSTTINRKLIRDPTIQWSQLHELRTPDAKCESGR